MNPQLIIKVFDGCNHTNRCKRYLFIIYTITFLNITFTISFVNFKTEKN